MRSKDKDKSKERKKKREKHKRKEGKLSKDKNSRRDSSDSSDSDQLVNVTKQLASGRAAARATREILAYNYELRRELRELARKLDSGGALDISGIPDSFLRGRLSLLFDNLLQLRKTTLGRYRKRSGGTSPVLSFLAPILEESPGSLATYARPAGKPQEAAEQQGARGTNAGSGGGERLSPTAAEPAQGNPGGQQGGEPQGDGKHAEASPPAAVIRPAVGPPRGTPEAADGLVDGSSASEDAGGDQPAAATLRVLGPAMPPPEVLAAAAAMAPPAEHAELEEVEFVVGPPPPEMEEEADLASMDERSAEVMRVMRVLKQHESSGAGLAGPAAAGAAPAPHPADAYSVLGAEPADPAGAIKKRYWRLSLLIHPDKCEHEHAATAFQAVATAAAELQDATARAAVDERREEAALRREAAAHAALMERERQWRVARGQATPEDLAGPSGSGAPSRESWMTELPPEASISRGPPQGNQTTFSSKGIQARGDTSAWTSTPQQRALQIEGGGGGGSGGRALLTGAELAGGSARAQRTAAVVDAYNANARGKTLLEAHLERQQAATKKGKVKKRKAEGATGAGEAGQLGNELDKAAHPWRPFDRERDLEAGPAKASDPKEMMKSLPALGSRFGGSQGGQRSFL